ncbi:hypothetical protein ACQ86F_34660 [Streptomyces venezuelae ATCC 10712]
MLTGLLATVLIASMAPAASASTAAVTSDPYPTTDSQVAVSSEMYPVLRQMMGAIAGYESFTPFTANDAPQFSGYWNKPEIDRSTMRGSRRRTCSSS